MAVPRVFVSSTWYDLRYIRENLKFFIRAVGYEPVLSEEGNVYYDPRISTADACLAEVPNTQLFVLLVGGRRGSVLKDGATSVTNGEYREAVRLKIPIFALVESAVHGDYQVYVRNRDNAGVDPSRIVYPSVDSTAVFDFTAEVRSNAVNNALVPFRDFDDIKSYLAQQWAGMMFSFLTRANEGTRVADTLEMFASVNARIEMLTRQILQSVGTDEAKLTSKLYDQMLASEAVRDLSYMKGKPTPSAVLKADTYEACAKLLGVPLKVTEEPGFVVGGSGSMSRPRFEAHSAEYLKLRRRLLDTLAEHGESVAQYVKASERAAAG